MSIKIPKISYFSVKYNLNEKKKVPFKKYGLERWFTRNILLEGGLIINRGLEMFKKGSLTRDEEKWRGRGLRPSKKL